MFRIVQKDPASATSVAARTRYLFSAENRMTFWMKVRLAGSVPSARISLPPHRGERRAQARLGVDEEVGAGDDPLALLQPADDLHRVAVGRAELDLARLEAPLRRRHEDDVLRPGADHGVGGDAQPLARRRPQRDLAE